MELTALRHGQSAANAAFAAAVESVAADLGAEPLKTRLGDRDRDIPLSPAGEAQAARIGDWFARVPRRSRPEVVVSSPYRRTRQTWQLARSAAGARGVRLPEATLDSRLEDRHMGELELLTDGEIAVRFPEEVERRRASGEARYRPPGGEAFPDVSARLAPLLSEIVKRYAERRVLVVVHDAVVLALRHLIEGVSWQRLLAAEPVANGSLTRWAGHGTVLRLVEVNRTEHLSQ